MGRRSLKIALVARVAGAAALAGSINLYVNNFHYVPGSPEVIERASPATTSPVKTLERSQKFSATSADYTVMS